MKISFVILLYFGILPIGVTQIIVASKKVEMFKNKVVTKINSQLKTAQMMVDKLFSFGELEFQESETSSYISSLLEKNGFQVTKGISGVPSAWWAKWGSGKPVIAIGSDLDYPTLKAKP